MKDIYLDNNIIIYLENLKDNNKDEFIKIFNILKKNKVFYSYGHLEERNAELLTNKDKDEAERLINKRIDFLEEITFNNEVICDFSRQPAVFCKKIENIRDTYKRVNKSELFNKKIDNGMKERYKNSKFIKEKYQEFEVSEEIKQKAKTVLDFGNPFIRFLEIVELEKKEEEKNYLIERTFKMIFWLAEKEEQKKYVLEKDIQILDVKKDNIENILEFFKYLKQNKIYKLKSYFNLFSVMETVIEDIFCYFNIIEYSNDKPKDTTYRSREYDVTHAILATQCDVFITADKKFFRRIKLVYDSLGIKTKVYLTNAKNYLEDLNNILNS
jgi:hypothetical protein